MWRIPWRRLQLNDECEREQESGKIEGGRERESRCLHLVEECFSQLKKAVIRTNKARSLRFASFFNEYRLANTFALAKRDSILFVSSP